MIDARSLRASDLRKPVKDMDSQGCGTPLPWAMK